MFGYSKSNILGKSLTTIMPERYHDAHLKGLNRLVTTGKGRIVNHQVELYGLRKDGKEFPLELTLSKWETEEGMSFTAIINDITERKRVENELKQSKAKYEALIENIPGATYSALAYPEGPVTFISERWKEWTGYGSKDFYTDPQTWLKSIHPDDRESVKEKFSRAIANREKYTFEYRLVHKDTGEVRWVNDSAQPILDDRDEIIRFDGIVTDLTERKKSEELLELERNKLTAILDSMADGVFIVNNKYEIEYANPVILKEFGDICEKKCYEYFHDRDKACSWCRNDEVFQGKTIRWECYFPSKQRTYDLVDTPLKNADGSISNLEIFRDITDRKQAEEALRESEERYKNLVGNIPGAIYRCALDRHWTMHYISDMVSSICGYPAADFIGNKERTFNSVIHPDDRDMLWEEVSAAIERKEAFTVEYRILCAEGNIKWVLEEGRGIFDEAGRVEFIDGALFDITDKMLAEKALLESEDRFRNLVANIPGLVYRYGLGKDWTMLYISEMAEEITGYPAADFVDSKVRTFNDVIHPDDQERVWKIVSKGIEEKKSFSVEYRVVTADGKIKWVLDEGRAVPNEEGESQFLDGAIFDITDSKEAEKKIAHLAKFPSENPNPVLRISGEGIVLYSNDASSDLLRSWGSVEGECVNNEIYDIVSETLVSGQSRELDVECQGRILSLSFTPLSEMSYVNVYALDVTDRRQGESERERLLGLLKSKNKELETFAHIVRHDLGQPLLSLQAFTSELSGCCEQLIKLLEGQHIDEDRKEKLFAILSDDIPSFVDYIQTASSSMSKLLEGLRRVAAVGRIPIDIEPLDVNKILHHITGSMKADIKSSNISLTVEGLPGCMGDHDQITQLFTNLLTNAIKYLDPERKGIIRVSGEHEGGQSIYCIEDNGIGISADHKEKIFEIFHRAGQGDSGGEGLGLTIVKLICERHNGQIWLESEPGVGSRFFAALPGT
jgi:PAS domain S-box-containing protein